jgi:uncharacterized peroxidase-related enzyme
MMKSTRDQSSLQTSTILLRRSFNMARLHSIDPTNATGKAKELLDAVQKQLGITPNMFRTMANSPAVLGGFLNFSGALHNATLSAKLREQLALAVSETNSCEYCLSAHTAIGKMVGLDDTIISASRQSVSSDSKVDAALKFSRALVNRRGDVTNEDFIRLRSAGYSDGEIAEIIAWVALTIFTNYFNIAAQVEVDFPKVSPALKKAA